MNFEAVVLVTLRQKTIDNLQSINLGSSITALSYSLYLTNPNTVLNVFGSATYGGVVYSGNFKISISEKNNVAITGQGGDLTIQCKISRNMQLLQWFGQIQM